MISRREFGAKFVKAGALFLPATALALPILRVNQGARVGKMNRPVGPGTTPCTDLKNTKGGNFDDLIGWSFYTYLAAPFTPASSYTVCKVEAELFKAGTINPGTLTAKIYTQSGASPGSLVNDGTSNTVNRASITTTPTYWTFDGLNAALDGSVTYWLVLQTSALDVDSSNSIYWTIDTTGESDTNKGSELGTSWDSLGGSRTFNFKTYA